MSTTTAQLTPTKAVLRNVRFSYAHVWEPSAIGEGTDKKYSVSLIISKDNVEAKKLIDAAIEHLQNEVKAKNKGKLPPKFKLPLRDGDEERPEDDAYANSWFVNASSKTKPGVVNKAKEPITDQDKFYSGCYGHASVNFYAFDVNGNKGIACGLNNLMKTREGDALAGKASAEQDFADIEEVEDDLL